MLQEFRELLKFAGWGRLVKYAQGQVELRQGDINSAAGTMDGLVEREFKKGEMSGILLFTKFPEFVIESFEENLKELQEALRNEENSTSK